LIRGDRQAVQDLARRRVQEGRRRAESSPPHETANGQFTDVTALSKAELQHVFDLIAQEHQDRGQALPKDTTEIVHA
jgi:hypothetical protein